MDLSYLAVRDSIFTALFEEAIGTLLREINDKNCIQRDDTEDGVT